MQYEELTRLQLIDDLIMDCDHYEQTEGLNPLGIYCSHTGRKFGVISKDEIRLILEANGITRITPATLDLFIDRCLLSTRPSPAWIVQSRDNMDALLTHDPVGAAVKYLSLAVDHEWRYKKQKSSKTKLGYIKHQYLDLESRKDWHMMMISLHHSLNQIASTDLISLTSILLKADAEIGLQRITPPKSNPMINDSGEVILTLSHWQEWIKHYTRVLLEHDAKPIYRQPDGNARSIHQFNHYKKLHTAPSKAKVAKQKKAADSKRVDDIFDELMNMKDGTAKVTDTVADRFQPEVVPPTPKQERHARRGITFLQQGKQNPKKLKLRLA